MIKVLFSKGDPILLRDLPFRTRQLARDHIKNRLAKWDDTRYRTVKVKVKYEEIK